MRLEDLSVALRQRDSWEALDLGLALWRRHWRAIMRPWLGLTLPVLVLLGALGWALDAMWLAALALWWLKPWFDRIPLYVLSRAVFGSVPGTFATLRARELYSPGLASWLSYRRLHPARALLLPVDLLENARGTRRDARVAVLQRAVGAQAFGLMVICLCFEAAAWISLLLLGLMFVPTEFLSESARAVWMTMFEAPPLWAQGLGLFLYWLALSAIEPAYVAAGFGLYLNRRTQLEAWDVELVFRRLATRARAAANSAVAGLLALALLGASLLPADAQAQDKANKSPPQLAPAELVGESASPPDPKFSRALDQAFADPSLSRTRKVTHYELRYTWDSKPDKPSEATEVPAWLKGIAFVFGAVSEYGLWILVGLLVAFLLWRLPRWLPWFRERVQPKKELPALVESELPAELPMPDDVPAAAASLWQQGKHREALALLYRASVLRLADRLGTPFPPGATEADCLRRSRRLDDAEARASFAEVVRTWQRAAYAQQFPDANGFATLLAGWVQRFPAVPA